MTSYLSHPVFQDMLQLGCKNQWNTAIAFQVYMDLCEVRVLRDVEYAYNKDIDSIYLKGRESHSSENPEIYIPLSSTSKVDLSWIRTVQNTLCSGQDKKSVTLALKAPDSTIVYYKMTEGIVPPDSPETAKRKKLLSEKRHYLGLELHQRQLELLDKACANKEEAKNVDERNNVQRDIHNLDDTNQNLKAETEKTGSIVEAIAEREDLNTEITLNSNKNSPDISDKNSPEIQEIGSDNDTSCSY